MTRYRVSFFKICAAWTVIRQVPSAAVVIRRAKASSAVEAAKRRYVSAAAMWLTEASRAAALSWRSITPVPPAVKSRSRRLEEVRASASATKRIAVEPWGDRGHFCGRRGRGVVSY